MSETTAQDERDFAELHALGEELSQAEQSPWEPRCVARAFATRAPGELVFRMQTWIDLELARSPLLQGLLPEAEEMSAAFVAFGMGRALAAEGEEALTGEEIFRIATAMQRAIQEGFAMLLRVKPTLRPGETMTPVPDQGMGTYLPVWACLVSQCGLAPAEADALEVGRAYALIAGHRVNATWTVEGSTYRLRDLEEEEVPHA